VFVVKLIILSIAVFVSPFVLIASGVVVLLKEITALCALRLQLARTGEESERSIHDIKHLCL
jgi:hypothetical protein